MHGPIIRLVVNADDLGMDAAIDEGILRAHREGIVTSATVLVGGRDAPDAVARATAQGLALGVHLCLTTGVRPAAGALPTLAPDGAFRRSWLELATSIATRRVSLDEVDRELRAQVALARQLGFEPDHLDGHQHVHCLPGIAGVVASIAAEAGLPVRWPVTRPRLAWLREPRAALKTAVLAAVATSSRARMRGVGRVHGLGVFEAGRLDLGALLAVLETLAPGDHELGCHPGLDPGSVADDPTWRYGWTTELAALCSPEARAAIEARGIRLCAYGELATRA